MSTYILVGGVAIIIYGGVRLYVKLFSRRLTIVEDLSDKTILITGASDGIGLEAAQALAAHGTTVHMLCRNVEKANKVANKIKASTKNDRVYVWVLDTSKLSSVRNFVDKFLATNQKIDVLINNAGAWFTEYQLTEDGLEMTMATNHFGHFLLTNLLLERIKQSKNGRIINVSSHASYMADLDDFSNMNKEKYSASYAYSNSKLANVIFNNELARRLGGTGITVNSLHPGTVATQFFSHMSRVYQMLFWLLGPLSKTEKEGAATTLYLATSPEVENVTGKYFSDCKQIEPHNKKAKDEEFSKDFWEYSAKMTQLK